MFTVIEYERFIDMVSDSTQLLTFKKLPLLWFKCVIREYPQLFKKDIKIILLPNTILCEVNSASQTSVKTKYCKTEYRSRYEIQAIF